MIANSSENINLSYLFSIAPMLDCTDRHFRVLFRQISKKSLLYTEMVVAKALLHESARKLLDFSEIEHPISLQLGGDNPKELSEAVKLAKEWGYDEVNLNLGCPSARVQSGNFGACLMANPNQVARCIEAMKNASDLPITIKHRTGIDNLDSFEFLLKFVDEIALAGADRFAIHARKAWLKGLNPKQNRTIPPLEYEKVEKLKKIRPQLTIELNGGLSTPIDCKKALEKFDGAMVGRAVYSNPLMWQEIDSLIYGTEKTIIKPSHVIRGLMPYVEKHLANEGRIWDMCKHLLQLVQGMPGARAWRTELSNQAQTGKGNLDILDTAAIQLEAKGL